MLPLIALAAGGATIAAIGKMHENQAAADALRMRRRMLADQRNFLDKEQKITTAEEAAQLSASTTIATSNSRNIASQEFQKNSAIEAASGVSGSVGGTAFFNIAKSIADSRTAVSESDFVSSKNTEGMYLGFMKNDLGYDQQRNNLDWQSRGLDLQEAQDAYANSPLSWGLSLTAGGLNGISMGSSLMATANSMGYLLPKTKQAAQSAVPSAALNQATSIGFQSSGGALPLLKPNFNATPQSSWMGGMPQDDTFRSNQGFSGSLLNGGANGNFSLLF